jgi:hypothetical protein
MKAMVIVGVIVLALGIMSFVVPVRRTDHSGFSAGPIKADVETHHDEKLPVAVGVVMVLAGAGLVFAAKR